MPKEKAWEFNQQRNAADEINDTSELDNSSVPYTREMFDALILRYEEPIANNRWDKPLFTILPETTINFDDVNAALYEMKPPPPNLATQNVRKEKGVVESNRMPNCPFVSNSIVTMHVKVLFIKRLRSYNCNSPT